MMAPLRTLIISPNWIGDAVMAQPLLALLKQQQPGRAIDVLAPPSVAPIWRLMAEVDNVMETPFRHGALQLKERRAFARQLRAIGYADAYVLPNTIKYALIPWLAGIARRVGYRGEMRYGLLNVMHRDDPQAPRAMVPFYAALASAPAAAAPGSVPRPRLQVSAELIAAAAAAVGIDAGRPWLVMGPGAEFGPAKRWPAAHFAALAAALRRQRPQLQIVLLGSPKDREVCAAVLEQQAGRGDAPAAGLYNLAGNTSLTQAAALIAGAQAMVANDSGLLHIASALNRPIVALYGPTDPLHAPPFSDRAASLSLQLSCAPCRQRVCPLGHQRCMQDLTPQMVQTALDEVMQGN